MEDKGVVRVKGYQFLTEEDAEKARLDQRKIEYLQSHTEGMKDANAIAAVYQKAIENKIFTTPVGWSYLDGLRQKMIDLGTPEDAIRAIPVTMTVSHVAAPAFTPQTDTQALTQPVTPEQEVPAKQKITVPLLLSLVGNAILVILVIVMFIIAYMGETNNILNYRRNITNQYSSWEERLKEREANIRAKEESLGIQPGAQSVIINDN